MDEYNGEPSDGIAVGEGGVAPRVEGAAPRAQVTAGHAAGIQGGAQQAAGEPPDLRALLEALRRTDSPSATMAIPRALHARLELDDKTVGTYMRDAIERGGYRAALDHYGGAESEKSDMPWHRFKAKGWLLGRLGHYDRMKSWLEEGTDWPDFDLLLSTAASVPRAAYKSPPLWLETPKPVPLSADRMIGFEPVAAACCDLGAVPDYIWAVMLILDATGPLFSSVGLGAALSLVEAGADWRAPCRSRGDRRYDPCRGARLHGAPEGCQRWIIADIDFNPWPSNGPHYYYDLTDEGRGVLAAAKSAHAPWQKEAEAAASSALCLNLDCSRVTTPAPRALS